MEGGRHMHPAKFLNRRKETAMHVFIRDIVLGPDSFRVSEKIRQVVSGSFLRLNLNGKAGKVFRFSLIEVKGEQSHGIALVRADGYTVLGIESFHYLLGI